MIILEPGRIPYKRIDAKLLVVCILQFSLATQSVFAQINVSHSNMPPVSNSATHLTCATICQTEVSNEKLAAQVAALIDHDFPETAIATLWQEKCRNPCPELDCLLANAYRAASKRIPETGSFSLQFENRRDFLNASKACKDANYPMMSDVNKRLLNEELRDIIHPEDQRQKLIIRRMGLGFTIAGAILTVGATISMGILEARPVFTGEYHCVYLNSLANQPCGSSYRQVTIPLLVFGLSSVTLGGIFLWKAKNTPQPSY